MYDNDFFILNNKMWTPAIPTQFKKLSDNDYRTRISYEKDMLHAQINTPGVEQKNISVIYNKETDSLNIKAVKEPDRKSVV